MKPEIKELVKFIVINYSDEIEDIIDLLEDIIPEDKLVEEKIKYAIDDEGFYYLL